MLAMQSGSTLDARPSGMRNFCEIFHGFSTVFKSYLILLELMNRLRWDVIELR